MLYDKAQCASPSPAYLEVLMVGERNEGELKRAVKSLFSGCVFVASAAHLRAGQTKLPSIHRL